VAYVVLAAGVGIDELRAELKNRLPDYMIPSSVVMIASLPLTPNGKLDRDQLPAPESETGTAAFLAPRNPIEERMAEIWCQVLGLSRVGVEDNFFELGGHSLLAAQLAARMRDAFQANLPLRLLFEWPTIAGLAKIMEERSHAEVTGHVASRPVPSIKRLNRAVAMSSAQTEIT
jgi:acyl carrier protein